MFFFTERNIFEMTIKEILQGGIENKQNFESRRMEINLILFRWGYSSFCHFNRSILSLSIDRYCIRRYILNNFLFLRLLRSQRLFWPGKIYNFLAPYSHEYWPIFKKLTQKLPHCLFTSKHSINQVSTSILDRPALRYYLDIHFLNSQAHSTQYTATTIK